MLVARKLVWLVVALLAVPSAASTTASKTGGVTFNGDKTSIYVSARIASKALGVPLDYDKTSDLAFLGSLPLDHESAVGEEHFVRLTALTKLGAKLEQAGRNKVAVRLNGRQLVVETGAKRAIVDKSKQELYIYQGGQLVLTSRVSTGKDGGSTPVGTFRTGYTKDAYKSSFKYNDAPMPWAVHVTGNVFIHGSANVPNYPASHGCVRLPGDAAEWFYKWVEPGTVVTIRA